MKRLVMFSNELSPFTKGGGLGVAIRRLVEQLASISVEVHVFLPMDCLVDHHQLISNLHVWFISIPCGEFSSEVKMAEAMTVFCKKAFGIVRAHGLLIDSIFVAHDNEMAISLMMFDCDEMSTTTRVFWMHSLYDHPQKSDYPFCVQELLPQNSIMASAIDVSDFVVMSSGVLNDALVLEWPSRLSDVQHAIKGAQTVGKIITAESIGCLPIDSTQTVLNNQLVVSKPDGEIIPYILFPSRPSLFKGFSFFAYFAKTLSHLNVEFISLGKPDSLLLSKSENIQWLPWLQEGELLALMKSAACVVVPSITEQYGLSAVEATYSGSSIIYHDVGGLRALAPYSNAMPVSLTTNDLNNLYDFWNDLLGSTGNLWPIWDERKSQFLDLLNRWTSIIEHAILTKKQPKIELMGFSGGELWGQILMRISKTEKNF